MDVARCIADFNSGRDPERLAMKFQKMRSDPFIFLRGACHLFYAHLPTNEAIYSQAPPVWLCGDLHLENFGSYKGDNRLTYFDINDFDEAALGPCTWDLVRFLVSVMLGTRSLGVKEDDLRALCRAFIDSYAEALQEGKARWVDRDASEDLVHHLLASLGERKRTEFLDTRTTLKGNKRKLRVDGRKALPCTEEARATVTRFLNQFAQEQKEPSFFKVIDVARRIAGTRSLGVDRFVILIEGKGSPDGNFLLDLKEARPSALVPFLETRQPTWESEAARVVTVQKRTQAIAMAFLHAVKLNDKPYILRGLQPSEDRVALDEWRGKLSNLESLMQTMANIVAWAHLRGSGRQGSAVADEMVEFGQQEDWRGKLMESVATCCEQTESDWREFCGSQGNQ